MMTRLEPAHVQRRAAGAGRGPDREAATLKHKLGRDIGWNLISFAFVGSIGLLLNALIGRTYGPAILGVFNQTAACYIVASQFCVFGLHLSVLKHVSQFAGDRARVSAVAGSGLALTVALASVVTAACAFLPDVLGRFFSSEGVRSAWLWTLPGLWCFAVNKTLMFLINGLRHMRAVAAFYALRAASLLAALLLCPVFGIDGPRIVVILSASEIVMLLALTGYAARTITFDRTTPWTGWIPVHLRFGVLAFGSGAVSELNTRVDVICLGYFVGDATVGLYSVAALFAEGLAQIAVIVRNNVNPLLSRYVAEGRLDTLAVLVKRTKWYFGIAMAAVGGVGIAVYPTFAGAVMGERFLDSWPFFAVLTAGLILVSGFLPLEMILVQGGRPGTYTLWKTATVLANAMLNLALVPLLGALGAACGTAGSYLLSAALLKLLVRRHLRIRI